MDTQQDIIKLLSKLDERIGHLDTVKLISGVLQVLTEEMKLKRASVAMLEPDHSGFLLRSVTFDIKEMEAGRFLPFESSPQSLCIQNLKPLYRPDIEKAKPTFKVDAKLLAGGLRSDFIVPLVIGGKCIGTVNSGCEQVDGISEYNRKLLTLIAPKLAQSLQNAKLHEDLQKSEKRYESLLNAMDELIFVLDENNRFISFYAPEEKLLEKPDAFLGKTHGEYMPPNVDRLFNESLVNVKLGKSVKYEYQLTSSEGEFWYTTTLSPIFEGGEYSGLVAVAQDITDRKMAEEELRQHRVNLEELVKVRTADLEEKNRELERYNKLFVGREYRIKELREEVKELREEVKELEKRLHPE